jgi:hypothetical protein
VAKKTLAHLIVAGLIAAMLSGAYAIVVNNTGGSDADRSTPSGFFH